MRPPRYSGHAFRAATSEEGGPPSSSGMSSPNSSKEKPQGANLRARYSTCSREGCCVERLALATYRQGRLCCTILHIGKHLCSLLRRNLTHRKHLLNALFRGKLDCRSCITTQRHSTLRSLCRLCSILGRNRRCHQEAPA